MEIRLARQYPLISLSAALLGAALGIVIANLKFEDVSVLLGARVLFGVLGFMAAYAAATWYLSRRSS